MNKLSHLKSATTNARKNVQYVNNIGQSPFNDRLRDLEDKGVRVPFKINWATLCHMHELRLWTITYAPSTKNNLQRMQELHRINNEALYLISNSLYKRVIFGTLMFFVISKLAKRKYLNDRSKDSHDVSFRDNTATM